MNKRIELKPLKYKSQPTLIGMIYKIEEEDREFSRALLKNDIDNAIEEFYDRIQVSLNALRMLGIPLEVIVEGQEKHFKKLKNRGWEFEDNR